MARSLNKVELIGNLTRDPELRYTPSGRAVCSFGIATNRQWKDDSGATQEDVEFHRIVAWQKLAEICAQLLKKGRKVYLEGRLQTRKWTGQDGVDRTTTEIVLNEMILLDSKFSSGDDDFDVPDDEDFKDVPDEEDEEEEEKTRKGKKTKKKKNKKSESSSKKKSTKKKNKEKGGEKDEEEEDIPF